MTQNGVAAATITDKGEIVFRDGLSKEEWFEAHRQICKWNKYSSALLRKSRQYGIANFGEDYAAEAEAQALLDLGETFSDKPDNLNPPDKSRAIVTIEGISQSFAMWHRKMAADVEEWDDERCRKALELVNPLAEFAARLREKLGTNQ